VREGVRVKERGWHEWMCERAEVRLEKRVGEERWGVAGRKEQGGFARSGQ